MKCRIVKIDGLSGNKASIYSVYHIEEKISFFDKFIKSLGISYKSEIKDIVNRLKTMGNKTGVREIYFKLKEGKPGDGVCALYDLPDKKLRIYCIRYGSITLIIGGGGIKPKNIRALQEDPVLTKENELIRKISEIITTRIKSGDISYINDGMDFYGNLEFKL